MNKLVVYLFISMLSFGLTIQDVHAKRFGGGRSFGMQRSKSNLFHSSSSKSKQSFTKSSNSSKWAGALGGLLLGGLLATLFMGHGLASGLLSWLILGSLVLFVVSFMRKKRQSGFHSAAFASAGNAPFRPEAKNQPGYSNSSSSYYNDAPPNFEETSFLRDAKVTFIRLQAAFDQNNLNDIRVFTAPEVFAEIKMQLEERGNNPNHTEVVQLNATLLDVSQQADGYVATVRFTGVIKENDASASPLDELWHFRQFSSNQDWVVGGIQQ